MSTAASRTVDAQSGTVQAEFQAERKPSPREEEALERDADRTADTALAGSRPALMPPSVTSTGEPRLRPHVSEVLAVGAVTNSSGLPLSLATRAYFEPRFGHDLSQVRIHRDQPAAERIGARAFTYGRDIAFAPGEYAPAASEGRRLLAHELAHVLQQEMLGRPQIQRKDTRDDADAKEKPKVKAITAQQYALTAEATLTTEETVTIELKKNDKPPGRHKLIHMGGTTYTESPETAPSGDATSFKWVNPWLDRAKRTETKYDWSGEVEVIITQSAEQRIAALPDHIRRLLTTDSPNQVRASTEEIEAVADAGELLAKGGLTEDEVILLEEKSRLNRELGHTTPDASDPLQFAQNILERRIDHAASREKGFGDLKALAKELTKQPLYLTQHNMLGTLLVPSSKLMEAVNIANMARFYRRENDLPPSQKLEAMFVHGLLQAFRQQLNGFETALVADVGAKGAVALDQADAALLRMDRAYVGMWQPSSPSPHYFWRHLMKAKNTPVVRQATALRDAARQELDRQEDEDAVPLPTAVGGLAVIGAESVINELGGGPQQDYTGWRAHLERQKRRAAQRDSIDKAYERVARESTGLKLPPNAEVASILNAKDPDEAIIKLRDWLSYGREKIRTAHGRLNDRKFIFNADIWLEEEKKELARAAGGGGNEIASLIDSYAALRKSETSFWEDLVKVVQFVAMFIPGPIGWGLRATTAIIQGEKRMGELADQRTLYTVGASSVDASTWEALETLGNMVMDVVPDMPGGALANSERRGLGLTDDVARVSEHGAERAGKSTTDAVEDTVGHTEVQHTGAESEMPHGEGGGGELSAVADDPVSPSPKGEKPTSERPVGPDEPQGVKDPEKDVRGEVKSGRNILLRAEEDMKLLKADDLRGHQQELHKVRAELSKSLSATENNIARLEEHIETLQEKYPKRSTKAAEDNLAEFKRRAADERASLNQLEGEITEVESDIEKLSPKQQAAPPPAAAVPEPAKEPIGEFSTTGKTTLQGTRMDSRLENVYVGVRQDDFRPNVQTLLQKDKDGPLSKVLLGNDNKIIPYDRRATLEQAASERRVFVAGHAYSSHAAKASIANEAERDFVILTSDYRNRMFNSLYETSGAERMSEFAYVIQGIAVEPGTAWELVEHAGLPAEVVTNAPKIRLVK